MPSATVCDERLAVLLGMQASRLHYRGDGRRAAGPLLSGVRGSPNWLELPAEWEYNGPMVAGPDCTCPHGDRAAPATALTRDAEVNTLRGASRIFAIVLSVLASLCILAACGTRSLCIASTGVPAGTATPRAAATRSALPITRTTTGTAPTPAPTGGTVTTPAVTVAETVSLTGTVVEPQIVSFWVSPTVAAPGEPILLAWQASGDQASICPSARFILFTEDDCWQVPLSGTATFAIPLEAGGNRAIDFRLTVHAEGAADPVPSYASVAFRCHTTWFYSDDPQAGICPLKPIASHATAQRFERGWMIWIEGLGRYVILENEPLQEGDLRRRVTYVHDPLDVVRDTSEEVTAPDGFYAPISGFGLLWRGDTANRPAYREALGWALAPESGYETVYQCDDALPSGGRSWQTCYLSGPEGDVVVLDPLGRWYLLEERSLD